MYSYLNHNNSIASTLSSTVIEYRLFDFQLENIFGRDLNTNIRILYRYMVLGGRIKNYPHKDLLARGELVLSLSNPIATPWDRCGLP